MKEITSDNITRAVAHLFISANCHVRQEIFDEWLNAMNAPDNSPQAREVLGVMIKNASIAWERDLPMCQDTGLPIVIIEQGVDVKISGKPLFEAVNEGIEIGGKEGYLRKSVVIDPLDRNYGGSYGPALIRQRILPGDKMRITLQPAGCGAEQMSCAGMFPPWHEEKTLHDFVLHHVKRAGSRPCPPTIIGIGIGGDLQESGDLARRALLRPIGKHNERYRDIEISLFEEINALNIGPLGLGGRPTVFTLNIEAGSCHRANLSIALLFNCHLGRFRSVVLCEGAEIEKEYNFREKLRKTASELPPFTGFRDISLPLTDATINGLKIGDKVLLNGVVYTARDAAHKRLVRLIEEGRDLPFPLRGETIYYVGPTPPRPGQVIGSAGPTTSARMDPFTPRLLSHGLKAMIGKGYRGPEVIDAIRRNRAIYFITYSGAGALLSGYIAGSEVIAFDDLGTEAIRRLELKGFPAIVACDIKGRDLYQVGA